jgi:uncharacterized protein (TIGR02594 family)
MKAYELAKAEVGTVEWKDGSNPKVVAYFKDSGNAGVKDDATAWCAAFVGAMLARSGVKGTGKMTARSYLEWGDPVDRSDAKPGDIVVFKRGNSSWRLASKPVTVSDKPVAGVKPAPQRPDAPPVAPAPPAPAQGFWERLFASLFGKA